MLFNPPFMHETLKMVEIGGTLAQPIANCLKTLDVFLTQTNPVVASMVVNEKRNLDFSGNLVGNISNILGIKDLKTISLYSPLSELGIDSITALEIKQKLEFEHQIYLNLQEIRKITFAKLQELQEEITTASKEHKSNPLGQENILPTVQVKTKKNQNGTPDVILFPSIEGVATVLEPLTTNLNLSAVCVQFDYDSNSSIEEIAIKSLKKIEKLLPKNKTFKIISYSFGTLVALKMVSMLEKEGYKGSLACIDGAPKLFHILLEAHSNSNNHDLLETGCLIYLRSLYLPTDLVNQYKDFEKLRLKMINEQIASGTKHSKQFLKNVAEAISERASATKEFKVDFKLKSNVTLYKPTNVILPGIAEDYHLSDLTENPVEVKTFEGNHQTILQNPELAEAINMLFL